MTNKTIITSLRHHDLLAKQARVKKQSHGAHPPLLHPLLKGEEKFESILEDIPSPSRERVGVRGTQKGFSSAILVVVLTMGVIAGVWLIQTGTSFFPNASEQEGLNPSAGRTKDCNQAQNKDECLNENNAICARDTVTYCDNRSGSPRAIRKSGGYYEPGNTHADPASGCVFDYREVPEKNSECAKSESKSGDVVYTTKEEAQRLDSERERTRSERERQSGGGGGGNVEDPVCKEPGVETAMKDEKVTGNLVRYYAILAGQPNYCTPADLGVEPKKEAQSSSGKTGRLMLCSKSDASLTWRVLVDSKLEASSKEDPSKEQVESEMSQNVESALKVASPTQPTSASQPIAQSASTAEIPPIKNGSSILRQVADSSLCNNDDDVCNQDEACYQLIANYPNDKSISYKCERKYDSRVNLNSDPNPIIQGAEVRYKFVDSKECVVSCASGQKCIVMFSREALIANTKGPTYMYFCTEDDAPEGRLRLSSELYSSDDGFICNNDVRCKSRKCNITGSSTKGQTYGICAPSDCAGGVCP